MRSVTLYVVLLRSFLETPVLCLLRYDQTPPAAIDDSCSPSPPRVCRSSAVRLLATSLMQCSTLRWHCHSPSLVITVVPRCFMSLVASARLSAPVRPALPYTTHALRFCSPKLHALNRILGIRLCPGATCLHLFIFSDSIWVPVA